MKYIIVGIIIVVLYISFVSSKIVYAIYFSGLTMIEQEDKIFGEGEELRFIVAGDSVALGLGASSVENTFTYRVAESLGKKNKIVYKNIAVKGTKTSDIIEEQLNAIIAFNPDIIVITIGGNDATHLKSKESILDNYNKIIKKLESETDAKIYMSNIPNFNGIKPLPKWYINIIEGKSSKVNPKIQALSTERVTIINVHDRRREVLITENPLAPDGFHANDYGYIF